MSIDPSSAERPGPKGYANKWGLESITPGCIAMAAVVVSIFTLAILQANHPYQGSVYHLAGSHVF
jgi:hypothetical protein